MFRNFFCCVKNKLYFEGFLRFYILLIILILSVPGHGATITSEGANSTRTYDFSKHNPASVDCERDSSLSYLCKGTIKFMMDSNTSKIPQECISGYGTFKGNISGRVYNLSYGDTFQSETPESFSGSITIRNTCADITTIGGNALLGLFQLEQGVWINFLLIKDLPLVTTCGIDLEDAISLPSVTGSEKGIRSVRVNKNIASGRGILTFTPSSTESDLGVLNRDDDHQNGVITYTINSSPLVGGVWTFKTEEAQEIELQANYAKAVAGHYSGTMTARISCE